MGISNLNCIILLSLIYTYKGATMLLPGWYKYLALAAVIAYWVHGQGMR